MSKTAGSQVQDEAQEYQYSMPWVTPSGHEFSFYETPDNERLVLKHASGSHIEFKADGSIFIKAAKDVHTHTSILSDENDQAKGADSTTNRVDTDYTWEVGGRLRIKCAQLDFEVGSTGRIYAGTDLLMSANNIENKATESLAMQSSKSMYIDAKEMKERVVSRVSEVGTKEGNSASSEEGGVNVMNVYGNAVIQNLDENGGITIASKGYLNLVSGAERVDVVGKFTDEPSGEAKATWTQAVYASSGSLDVSSMPGDLVFTSEAGAYYEYATSSGGSSESSADGFKQVVTTGNRTREVAAGDEDVTISGDQTIVATMIYLN